MDIFLDKVVLLSSAVADADNQVMMDGKKLELLVGMESILLSVDDKLSMTKSQVSLIQKKVEDLCFRILFQNCPNILIKPIISVLSILFSRGSTASMHACVSLLLQLAIDGKGGAGSTTADRFFIPGFDQEDGASLRKSSLSIYEQSVCLQVGIGLVVFRGPSASYFVPSVLSAVTRQMKFPDPAARETAVICLGNMMRVIGIPGSGIRHDIWKNILSKQGESFLERRNKYELFIPHWETLCGV